MDFEYIPYQRFLVEIQVLDDRGGVKQVLHTERIKSGTEARNLAEKLNLFKAYKCKFIDTKPEIKKKRNKDEKV